MPLFFCPEPPEYVTSDRKAQDSTDVTHWFVDRWEQYRRESYIWWCGGLFGAYLTYRQREGVFTMWCLCSRGVGTIHSGSCRRGYAALVAYPSGQPRPAPRSARRSRSNTCSRPDQVVCMTRICSSGTRWLTSSVISFTTRVISSWGLVIGKPNAGSRSNGWRLLIVQRLLCFFVSVHIQAVIN